MDDLSVDEWPTWKFEIRVLLNAAEAMDVVSGRTKIPVREASQTEADN